MRANIWCWKQKCSTFLFFPLPRDCRNFRDTLWSSPAVGTTWGKKVSPLTDEYHKPLSAEAEQTEGSNLGDEAEGAGGGVADACGGLEDGQHHQKAETGEAVLASEPVREDGQRSLQRLIREIEEGNVQLTYMIVYLRTNVIQQWLQNLLAASLLSFDGLPVSWAHFKR